MTFFELASWVLTITSFSILLAVWMGPRYLLIKPSLIMSALFLLRLQIPSAIHASEIEEGLPDPLSYLLLIHLLPVIVLTISSFTFRRSAWRLYSLSRESRVSTPSLWSWDVITLNLVLIAVLVWYLFQVPWNTTGLVAVVRQDPNVTLIREESLKLLRNRPLQYAYSLMTSVVAPLLAIVYALRIKEQIRKRNWILVGLNTAIVLVILVAISMNGSRAPSAITLACVFFAISLRSRAFLSIPLLVLSVVPILALPAMITLSREGGVWTGREMFFYFLNVLDRSFGYTFVDGFQHMQYVQTVGFFGMDGDPFMSRIFSAKPVDVFNVVGLAYYSGVQSVSSCVSYASAYYDCYGLWAFAPCIVMACLLDVSLIVMRRWISGVWLIACIAGCWGGASSLVNTFYSTAMITFGFALIPPVCIFLSRLNCLPPLFPVIQSLRGPVRGKARVNP